MRAAVFQGVEKPLQIEEIKPPTLDEDGVIVETAACGICRSDWHAWRGDWSWLGVDPTPGLVFGHEPVGSVVEVGSAVDRVSEGELVTVPFTHADGTCRQCRQGRANLCERGVPMGFLDRAPGAFAEQFPVRAADQNVVSLPDTVDPVSVAGLGCRFATAFHGLVHRVDLTPGDWVAVHGLGGVGLSAVHIADALGANVVGVDIDAAKCGRARDLGARATVDASAVDDVPRAVVRETDTRGGVAVSVDALGIPETCRNAINSLGKRGQHLQIGLTTADEGGDISLPVDRMVLDEREFYGVYGMPPHEYADIVALIEDGTLDPGRIVGETVSLTEVPDVIASMDDYDTLGIPVCTEF